MKFIDLIKSKSWLSVKMIFLDLYPDQADSIDGYREVFEKLHLLMPEASDMLIELSVVEDDFDPDETLFYVSVAGRKMNPEDSDDDMSYAIEFEQWNKWLGMELDSETLRNFSDLEIISHCLYEMTFCGFDEDEIQRQFADIKDAADDLKKLSKEEREERSFSLEDLMKEFDDDEDPDDEADNNNIEG